MSIAASMSFQSAVSSMVVSVMGSRVVLRLSLLVDHGDAQAVKRTGIAMNVDAASVIFRDVLSVPINFLTGFACVGGLGVSVSV